MRYRRGIGSVWGEAAEVTGGLGQNSRRKLHLVAHQNVQPRQKIDCWDLTAPATTFKTGTTAVTPNRFGYVEATEQLCTPLPRGVVAFAQRPTTEDLLCKQPAEKGVTVRLADWLAGSFVH